MSGRIAEIAELTDTGRARDVDLDEVAVDQPIETALERAHVTHFLRFYSASRVAEFH